MAQPQRQQHEVPGALNSMGKSVGSILEVGVTPDKIYNIKKLANQKSQQPGELI